MKTIKDIEIKNKTILVRVDYNVPLKDGQVENDLRIRASLPTLSYLREHGAKKIVLISHLGRPQGRDEKLSLEPVAKSLEKLIGHVSFIDDVSGPDVKVAVSKMQPGDILLLENLRFFAGEEDNSDTFIQEILDSVQPDFYIQDGFAVVHRAHASTDAIKNFLPVYAGFLVEKEVKNLNSVLEHPEKPFLFILGGSKVADKQPLIEKLLPKVDHITIGGKIAADGYHSHDPKIYVAEDFDENTRGEKLDIGPLSTIKISDAIAEAKTVVWNGLLGQAEDPAYATASTIIAEVLGEKTDTKSVICGGDTTAFVETLMDSHPNLNYSLISTGGGASLEFLLGNQLPGLAAIEK